MYVTKEEMIKTKVDIAKQMNKYIINLGDEEIWMDWITLGIPDAADEEDFLYFAEDNKRWIELCNLFGRLVGVEGAD